MRVPVEATRGRVVDSCNAAVGSRETLPSASPDNKDIGRTGFGKAGLPMSDSSVRRRRRPRGPFPASEFHRLVARCEVAPFGYEATPCVLWQGRKSAQGYGGIDYKDRNYRVHQVTYELLVGPMPDGHEIDHLCGVPSCVNVAHLEPVTKAENARRSWLARSTGPNPRPDRRKLTPEQREEVMRRARAGEMHTVIAAEFGITKQYVSILLSRSGRASSAAGKSASGVIGTAADTPPPPGLTIRFCVPCNRRDAAHRYGRCLNEWSH